MTFKQKVGTEHRVGCGRTTQRKPEIQEEEELGGKLFVSHLEAKHCYILTDRILGTLKTCYHTKQNPRPERAPGLSEVTQPGDSKDR